MTNTIIAKPPVADIAKPTPAAVTAINQVKAGFVANAKPTAKRAAPRTLADPADRALKVMVYGPTATGKTRIIADLLRAGLKVLAVNVDFGGEGFSTPELELRREDRLDLLANCTAFDLSTYDEVEAFVFSPTKFYPEIWDTDWDVFFMDGFSGFQTTLLDEKVLSMSGGSSASEARDAGLWADQQAWGQIKRGTTRTLDRFLRMKNERTGRVPHKFVTMHENSKPKEDKLSGEMRIGPLLQGAGASLIEPSFDLIFRTRRKIVEKKETFSYQFSSGDSKVLTKKRGLILPETSDANFLPIWESICQQRGFDPGPLVKKAA